MTNTSNVNGAEKLYVSLASVKYRFPNATRIIRWPSGLMLWEFWHMLLKGFLMIWTKVRLHLKPQVEVNIEGYINGARKMVTLILGMALILIGAISISFPDLCRSLKVNDEHQWKALGSPFGLSFTDMGKTIGVYHWILNFGYEKSGNTEITNLGKQALKKALFAKYTLLWGCLFLVLGFFASMLAIQV